MTMPPDPISLATPLTDQCVELYLPENEYNDSFVYVATNYLVTSTNDSNYAAGQHPLIIHRRHWPEAAPYRATYGDAEDVAHIVVIYRIYLFLPVPLQREKNYTVTINPSVNIEGPYSFLYGEEPSKIIHVNQLGYLPNAPKLAYLSWWTGDGTLDFSNVTSFTINDAVQPLFTGSVTFTQSAADEDWGKANLFTLDFSDYTNEGTYHIDVPSVGYSLPFQIDSNIYKTVGYTSLRGLTMQRDGAHGLDDTNVTHWTRPSAHLDDAIEESTGTRIDLVGGHMDAGDRGHYPWNAADASAALLTAAIIFSNQIEAAGENFDLPESANGVPDYLDEIVYELDWIYKAIMNTSKDGTLPFYLRPAGGGYEQFQPPSGANNRVFFDETQGPNRSETLYAAGAMALAYNTPLLQKFCPEKCLDYRTAALRAFNGFTTHHSDTNYWLDAGWYDPYTTGPHPWSDEMLLAAGNLLDATGDTNYITWITSEFPSDPSATKRWSWDMEGPWLYAYLSLARVAHPALPNFIRHDASNAVLAWADAVWTYDRPYGAPRVPATYNTIGWHHSGSMWAYPLMLAYGLSNDTKYRDALIDVWNYLLGANPLSRTFISGLGQPSSRPRWMVHEISQYLWTRDQNDYADGWAEMVPGISSADLQDGYYEWYFDDAWNTARKDKKYPAQAAYPPLYRYQDAWNISDEFVIRNLARQTASLIPLWPSDIPPYYTINLSATNGTIAASPALSSYEADRVVTLSAIPDWGYGFSHWSGDVAGSSNPVEIVMNTNKNISAHFTPVPFYSLTVQSAQGFVSLNPDHASYPSGLVVTLTAIPLTNYVFQNWNGDLSGSQNPAQIVMTSDKYATARYASGGNYSSIDIGTSFAGSTKESGGEITITGSGAQVWSSSDSFRYVYQNNITGSVTFSACLNSMTPTGNSQTKAGIMIRSSLETNAAFQAILVDGQGNYKSQYRNFIWASEDGTGTSFFPIWLKIQWNGIRMFTYISGDGTNWTSVGGQWFNQGQMTNPVNVGLFVCSGNDGTYASAEFQDVAWPQISSATTDADMDGLPDWWEYRYFLNTTGSSPQVDSDNDGMSNHDEFIAGTTPTNAMSLLTSSIELDSTRNIIIRWPSIDDKIYHLQKSTNGSSYFPLITNLEGIPPANLFTDTYLENQAIYRIIVQAASPTNL